MVTGELQLLNHAYHSGEQKLLLLEPCRQHGLVQFLVVSALPKPNHHDTSLAIITPLSQLHAELNSQVNAR